MPTTVIVTLSLDVTALTVTLDETSVCKMTVDISNHQEGPGLSVKLGLSVKKC